MGVCQVKWEPFNETQNSLFVCNGLTYFHVPKPINGSVIGEAPGIWYSYDPKDDLLTTLYDGGFDLSDHGWTWWLKKKEKKSNIENENKDAK